MPTKPYPFQREGAKQIELFKGRVLLADDMGLGKAQPIWTKIITPHGWSYMGELKIGDSVIGSDGKEITVTGVHPQGILPVFKVTFTDNSSTLCSENHLWSVQTPHSRWTGGEVKVKTLKDIQTKITDKKGNRLHFIPITKPVEFEDRWQPIDPYLMGYLLANGCFRRGCGVSIPDLETVDRLKRIVPDGLRLKHKKDIGYSIVKVGKQTGAVNKIKAILRGFDLYNKMSYQKHIPNEYRFNSVPKRIRLLQGLMDGDGYASKTGVIQYSSSSKTLINHVQQLVQSLGGVARLNVKVKPTYTYKGRKKIGRPNYFLTIALPNEIQPFLLKRKAELHIPRIKYIPARGIKSIEPAGQAECKCISVSAQDGLYLTNNYIVTHNSLQSLLWCHRNDEARPIIVVCPAGLKYQWAREAMVHFNMSSEILEGTKPPKTELNIPHGLIIVNYDILKPTKKWEGWLSYLKNLKPQIVICDEGQAISNRTSKQSKAVKELCKGVPHVLVLTGTPITNKPAELFAILHLIRPDLYPTFFPFAERFCNPRFRWGRWDVSGATNLKELHNEMKSTLMIRRTKEEVIKDLPTKQKIIVPMPLEKPTEYKTATKNFIQWLTTKSPTKAKRAQKAQKLVKFGYLLRLAASLKTRYVKEWIENFLIDTDEKLIVFGIHTEFLSQLRSGWEKISVAVNGSVTGVERQKAYDRFNQHTQTRLLFGNIKAAGTGWSATDCATVLIAELPWKPADIHQAIDRVHGLKRGKGQQGVKAFFTIAHGTIEEKLLKVIDAKQKICDQVMDGKKKIKDIDLWEELEKLLLTEEADDRRKTTPRKSKHTLR